MAAMVGRDQELAAVVRSLTAAEFALTLVVGEAGIGKSRLVAETVQATPERLTLAGGCLPMRHALPLLPVVDALDGRDPAARKALTRAARSLPGPLRPHIAGVMPRTLPAEIQPAEEVRRDQLFLATEALLSQVADERPVTLVVEDVHWADPDTLDLLTYLAGARHHTRLHVLVTCRSDETQMSEQVNEWLATLPRSSGVHELHLEPLGSDDVRRLIAALPHPEGVDVDRLAAAVFARGEGNPFFTEQLVASAADGEQLPHRLAKLLSARVKTVSPPAQEVITALAVLARPVPLAALRVITLHNEETCLSAVTELESASLVVRDDRGVKPRHALVAEALLAELPGFPAAYHRRVAHALASLDDPSTIPEIADHLHRAGDEPAELKMAQLAAQRAWDLGAYADAARRYQRVIDLHARHPEEPLLFFTEPEVVRRSIRALDLSGTLRGAVAMAEQALRDFADWPDLGDRLGLLSTCAQLVNNVERKRGERLIEDLLPLYDKLSPRGDHAFLLNRLASNQRERGETRKALALTEQALSVARAAGDLKQEAEILARSSICYRYTGDRAAADKCAMRAIQTAERSADGEALLFALIVESDNRLKYAEYEAAYRAGQRGIEVAEQQGLWHSFNVQLLVGNTAEAHLALAQTAEVVRLVDAFDQPIRRDDDVLSGLRAHADLLRGNPRAALARMRSDDGIRPVGAQWARVDAETLAYVLLWNRRPAEALDVVNNSLPAAAVGDGSQEAGLLLSLGARAAADLAQQDVQAAAEAIARLDDLRAAMALDPFADRPTLPRASADRRQWQAERTRADGRSDPEAWTAAASAWEALSMPHDAAYCWWRAAEALVALGADKEKIRAALHAAHRLSDSHLLLRDEVAKVAAHARIPILDASNLGGNIARERGLTAQETEVLRLLAGGFTNAEIGTALFISPKTASVHITHLLRKLQLSNRTEAAVWATRHGLTADT
jgi:DNA-binding CsgD family transcriptional regulator